MKSNGITRSVTKVVITAFIALIASFASPIGASAQPQADQAGDTYEIRLESESQTRGDNGSSGSSHSRSTLIERVIAVRDGGVELEFNFPPDTSAEDRARNWQFPARVFKPEGGALQLLNAPELEARQQAWMSRAGLSEAACGRWVFTWTAFKIECDPQSVLATLQAFDLRPGNTSARVEQLYPEAIRRERADADMAVAQMTGEPPLSFEAALQARAAEQYAGSIKTRFELDATGRVTRMVVESELELTEADGSRERTTRTTNVERRRIAQTPAH